MTREYQIAAQARIAAQAEELRPCPFCGKQPRIIEKSLYCSVECNDGHQTISFTECNFKEVKPKWNTRAAPPEGMVMVPREPTVVQVNAGVDADDLRTGFETVKHIYRTMLAAAEAPQEGE